MPVHLTFYDGADCIGDNKILLEDGSATLMLDFGTNFKAEGMYFDEFLNPRPTFGFSDLLALGILPPLKGLYRPDLEYSGIWDKYYGHQLFSKKNREYSSPDRNVPFEHLPPFPAPGL